MTLTVEGGRVIDAPLSLVWEIVSNLDTYHQHTNTLTETTVISGEGQGATRRCVDASGNSWEETCTIWEPEQRYAVDVDVPTYPAKYRMLFRTFKGTWNVEPAGGQTRVTIRFEAELRRIPGAPMLVDMLAKRSRSDLEAILDSYAQTATARAQ